MFHLRVLGSLDLRKQETQSSAGSVLAQPKRVALLCVLALASRGGFIRKDRLLAMFWQDLPDSRARKALNQAVYVLRRALGKDAIRTRGDEEIALDRDVVSCDATTFLERVEEGEVEEAMEHYGGELLPGFLLSDCPGFERWLDQKRRVVREAARDAAWTLAEKSLACDRPLEAARWAREAAAFDPLSEARTERLIRILVDTGDLPEALRAYQAFESRLAEELELEPGAELRALMEELVREAGESSAGVSDFRPSTARASSPSDEVAPPVSPLPVEPVPARAGPGRAGPGIGGARDPGARWARRSLGWSLAALALILAAGVTVLPLSPGTPVTDRPVTRSRVLIAPFQVEQGGPRLESLGVLVAERITRTVGELERIEDVVPPRGLGEPAGHDEPFELAARRGAGIVIVGHVFGVGDTARASVEIRDGRSGQLLREAVGGTLLVHDPEEGVDALSDRLAGSLATVVDPRMEDWARYVGQPPSLAAYRDWREGIEIFLTPRGDGLGAIGNREAAIDRFMAAADPESGFVQPLLWAVDVMLDRFGWRRAEADSIVRSLQSRKGELAPVDRAVLDALDASVAFQWLAALRAYEEALRIAPFQFYQVRASEAAARANRPRRAVVLFESLPRGGWIQEYYNGRVHLGAAYHALGRFDDQAATFSETMAGVDTTDIIHRHNLTWARASLLAVKGDSAVFGALERYREVRRGMGADVTFDHYLAREAWAHGHVALAEELARRGPEWYQRASDAGPRRPNAWWLHGEALAVAGRFEEADSVYRKGLAEYPLDPNLRRGLGFVAGRLGDTQTAREMEAWFEDVDPEQFRDRPWIPAESRAAIATGLGEEGRAVDLLKEALHLGLQAWQLHADHQFFPVADHPEFQEIVRPKG